jgi:hypothetical protein
MAMSGISTTPPPVVSGAAAPVPPYLTPPALPPPAANPTLELASRNETANATSLLFVILHSCDVVRVRDNTRSDLAALSSKDKLVPDRRQGAD